MGQHPKGKVPIGMTEQIQVATGDESTEDHYFSGNKEEERCEDEDFGFASTF